MNFVKVLGILHERYIFDKGRVNVSVYARKEYFIETLTDVKEEYIPVNAINFLYLQKINKQKVYIAKAYGTTYVISKDNYNRLIK